jgi:hypothetical protein
MDFLKQNNFRYIVIIIIIILAVINLCKINSQENFMNLTEDQNIGTFNVTMNSTDQVMFGTETLTHKLKNVDTLTVAGSAVFKDGAYVEGIINSTTSRDEGGQINISNPTKTASGKAKLWSIYNMTGVYQPTGLQFWRYPNGQAPASTLVLTDDGDTLVRGKLVVEGSAEFQTTIRKTRANNQNLHIISDKTLYLMAQENVHIYKCIPSNCEDWDGASGNLIVDGNLHVKAFTRIDGAMHVYGGAHVIGILWVDEDMSARQNLEVAGKLTVGGDIIHQGAITYSSDRRLKENIENISQNDKDKVLQLVPKTYNMISDQNKKRYGFIAQEVEELYPELVNTNETDGMKSLNYIELIPLLLEQIKELKKSVEQIKTLINM